MHARGAAQRGEGCCNSDPAQHILLTEMHCLRADGVAWAMQSPPGRTLLRSRMMR